MKTLFISSTDEIYQQICVKVHVFVKSLIFRHTHYMKNKFKNKDY